MMSRNDANEEAGDLGPTFDAVVEELNRVRKECEAHSRELLQRNRELAAAAAIAQVTSTGQLDLEGTLERALEVVLEVTGLPAGWILLLPQVGGESVLAGAARLPRTLSKGYPDSGLPIASASRC